MAMCFVFIMNYIYNFDNFINFLPTKMEKTIQGISEMSEKINPMVPAVEGIIIKIPAIIPQVAEDFPKSFDLYIIIEIIIKVIALNT